MADPTDGQGIDKRVLWALGIAFTWIVSKVAGAAWNSIERKWGSLEGLLSRVGALEKQNEMQQERIDGVAANHAARIDELAKHWATKFEEMSKHWAAKDKQRRDDIALLREENRQLWEKLK